MPISDPGRATSPRVAPPASTGGTLSRRATLLHVLALLFLATGTFSYLLLMGSLPEHAGSVTIAGLSQSATVTRDRRGVPRIEARTEHDAYFLLGWVHAQDRMWQMELQRRVAEGRLAEIVGESGLANDRFMRTLGLERLARQDVDDLDGPTRAALSAYADGVNAWIAGHTYRLPPEFLFLSLKPEPWRPADSLAWLRLMGLQLAGDWRDDILRARLAARLDPARLRDLFPSPPADAPATLAATAPTAKTARMAPARGRLAALSDGDRLAAPTARALLAALPDWGRPHLASNVWVVAGRRSASGKPLLANDPHLGFQAPILWYLASVSAPGWTVSGGTVPGLPFPLIGHTATLAWGLTATEADTVDLFLERPSPTGDAYATPNGWRPFATRTETIAVRGRPDLVLTVRTTRHGPIVSGLTPDDPTAPGQKVAFAAAALAPGNRTAQALYRLNHAATVADALTALTDVGTPVQNVALADTDGHIAFAVAGRVPLRAGGDGGQPVAGWNGAGDWTGWADPATLPRAVDPPSGLIVNANNRVAPAASSVLLTDFWPDSYRARRILDRLDGRTGLTPADMADLQRDDLSLAARDLQPLLATARVSSPLGRTALGLIARWNGHADRDRPEPLIFAAWTRQLWRDLLAPALGSDFPAFARVRFGVLTGLLGDDAARWCVEGSPLPSGHPCDSIAGHALDEAVADLAARHGADPTRWRWGDAHRALFINPILDHVPLVRDMADLSIPTDGDDSTVNRGTTAIDDFTHIHGAGMRFVADLADLAEARFVIATGQSGNALSHYYADQLAAWRANQGQPIAPTPARPAVLTLKPPP